MKREYTSPVLKVLVIGSAERVAADCGSTQIWNNLHASDVEGCHLQDGAEMMGCFNPFANSNV